MHVSVLPAYRILVLVRQCFLEQSDEKVEGELVHVVAVLKRPVRGFGEE